MAIHVLKINQVLLKLHTFKYIIIHVCCAVLRIRSLVYCVHSLQSVVKICVILIFPNCS